VCNPVPYLASFGDSISRGSCFTLMTEETRQRIREQSRIVATYIQAQNEIRNWINELEGYHLVGERLFDDIDRRDYEEIEKWLIAAWELGYEAGRQRGID
jgi:hypothetical protein